MFDKDVEPFSLCKDDVAELRDVIFCYRWRETITLRCEIRSASLIVSCQYTRLHW